MFWNLSDTKLSFLCLIWIYNPKLCPQRTELSIVRAKKFQVMEFNYEGTL